ncbi:MAG: 4'-phosphopantetheinyl transferase superfamily protein [Bacteroides sp.]|nr:4'-phosphopantetheinyl transferase superfamily protein [Bacteroides sp.]
MSKVIDTDNFTLYISGIAPGGVNRSDREHESEARMLSEIFGRRVELGHYADGAPYIDGMEDVEMSISHSMRTCVIGISKNGGKIGVDIESPRQQLERVKSKFLTDEELARLAAINDGTRRMEFLLKMWTAKEAAFKALRMAGIGLIDITVADDFDRASARGVTLRLSFPDFADSDGEMMCVAQPLN